ERAREAAQAAGIPTAHGSYQALLDDPEIDAVYIPLPNTLHAEWTRKAADRGKHVPCEKPLAPTAAEAREVIDYCRAKGVVEMNGLLTFADGQTGAFDCGFTLPYRGWLEIVGTEGVVFVPDMWLPPRRATFEIRRGGRYDVEEVVVEGEDQIVHMLENFGRA